MANDAETNGEYWLLEQVIAAANEEVVLIDIGANVGEWSERAVSLLGRAKVPGHVHAFEPTSSTFAHLSARFQGNTVVSPRRIALSDRSGETEIFVVGELAGTNSVYRVKGAISESVPTLRFDDFVERERVDHVELVKSDTEGHDMNVLLGASETLRHGRVDAWQFEYNHRWIDGKWFLKDVFDFVADKPYAVGKLYGNGIEVYEQWHPELERFFDGNYVLIRKQGPFEKLCSRVRFNDSNVLVPIDPHA